ncbi:MAG: amidohydrolase family protein [Myxococcales bacterium]|nr:amidohydrolase family protein [Myxococcales bacterium]
MTEPTPSLLFDCDNHYYEARDAFTRHVPEAMQQRCVQWAVVDGRQRHLVGGRVDFSIGNPTFDPVAKPGILRDYYQGNPRGRPAAEMMHGNLEPQPAAYVDPEARLAVMDAQGVEASWLFPTLGVLYEEPLKHDVEAVCALFRGFNRWLDEDWGLVHRDRIFTAPYLSLGDVGWACEELEWALSRDARIIVMRPAAIVTADGPVSPSHPHFDPFWARVDEAGITVVIHTGNSGYSSNGYASDTFGRASIGMSRRPSVKGLTLERAAHDYLLTLLYEKLFERFRNLRIASVENGSQFLPSLLRRLRQSKQRNPWHFDEDPEALFREHVFINPFWEDDLDEVRSIMGSERVIFGSDWPHMEGLPEPRGIFDEIDSWDAAAQDAFLRHNTRSLTNRRLAGVG